MAAMLGAPAKTQGPDGQQQEKRKKESILDLTKFLEKPVRVKFAGQSKLTMFKASKATILGLR